MSGSQHFENRTFQVKFSDFRFYLLLIKNLFSGSWQLITECLLLKYFTLKKVTYFVEKVTET